ncbi:hypothetical protein B9Z55_028244 [Caenorhabditis nigoni]|uniref:Uncharacterized protein n=1 Tax=Caenorhabditis nigoni TaxID=1611254 RepID=A0A2G5SCT7_9PELO|nr:hypothetical protein B9Z55_028244 [Caenorhabditis nigoni]
MLDADFIPQTIMEIWFERFDKGSYDLKHKPTSKRPSLNIAGNITSQLPNKEPPQKPKAKKDQPEKNIEKTGKADKEKEKNQADDLINEGPDVLTEPPMIIKREPSVPSNSLKTEPVATVESKPFRIETPPPTSVPLEDAEKIDSKELLNSLRNLVYTLDSRFLEKLQKSIETTLKIIRNRSGFLLKTLGLHSIIPY